MKNTLLAILITCVTVAGFAQQDPQYSFYMFDNMSYNPGYTGAGAEIVGQSDASGYLAGTIYRYQYAGFQSDAPRDILFNASGTFGYGQMNGLGLSFTHDGAGNFDGNYLKVSYARRFYLAPTTSLRAGVGVGMFNGAFADRWVAPSVSADLDPNIPNDFVSQTTYDVSLGLHLSFDAPGTYHQSHVGVSVNHLAPTSLSKLSMTLKPHIYVTGQYVIDLHNGSYVIPTTLIKTDFAAMSFDVGAIYHHNDLLFAGLTYRFQDELNVMVGVDMGFNKPGGPVWQGQRIWAGYAYGIPLGGATTASPDFGSHEIMLRYKIGRIPPIKVNPYRNTLSL